MHDRFGETRAFVVAVQRAEFVEQRCELRRGEVIDARSRDRKRRTRKARVVTCDAVDVAALGTAIS